MSTSIARFLSYLLHPLIMPTYIVLFLFNYNTYLTYSVLPLLQRVILGLVFVTTFAMPVVTSLLFLYRKKIQSLDMDSSQERNLPLIITTIYYLTGYFILGRLPIPRVFSMMMLGACISIFFAYIINLRWKVSIHMIGIGGLAGVFFAIDRLYLIDLIIPIAVAFLIGGILGTARLISGSHSQWQIYTGFLLGFACELVTVSILSS